MIGGEAAELAALSRRHVVEGVPDVRDPYDLGWVMDWLYGDAALPPMPLPEPERIHPAWERRPAHTTVASAPAVSRAGRPRRGARQLALL